MASHLRLLLVDDEEAILRSYTAFFVRHGATVVAASSGRDALEHMQAGRFDVVVSDIAMPEMSGLEFLMNVRSFDPDMPVILMTAAPDLETAVSAVEYGAFHYLGKPIDPHELWQVVKRAARHHQVAHRKRQALPGGHANADDRAALEARFESAMRLAYMAFQPIVSLRLGGVWGYEALLRTEDPVLNAPIDILNAAEQLGRRITDRLARDKETPLIRVSLGVAVYPHSAETLDALLVAADRSLYEMKSFRNLSLPIS